MIDLEKLKALAESASEWTEPGPDVIEVFNSREGYFLATEADMQFIAAANPAAVLELIAEVESLSHWRDLALQFDNHRMAALWHLKALLQSHEHAGAVHDFLDAPPMASHEVVTQRDRLKAENESLRKNATRYEWLRNEHTRPGCLSSDPDKAKWLNEYLMCGDKLDAAIDEQLAK